jgi:hypothetical protein
VFISHRRTSRPARRNGAVWIRRFETSPDQNGALIDRDCRLRVEPGYVGIEIYAENYDCGSNGGSALSVTRKDEIRGKPDYPSDPHTRVKHDLYRR